MSKARLDILKERYAAANQSHVFKYYDALSSAEQDSLLTQLEAIDVQKVLSTYKLTIEAKESAASALEPLPVAKLWKASKEQRAEWEGKGLSLIQQGQVAFLLLAGGQGTRLGTSDPKGCYDIGLPSHKSLFQLVAERLRRLRALASKSGSNAPPVPWYIMTSPMTDAATKAFFTKKGNFGLDKEDVFFFEQGTLPCISNDGNILMESRATVSTAPDGNGGVYRALVESGAVKHMLGRGVNYLHASSVDNALVLPADPLFIGYCVGLGADCGAKVVPKASPDEAVGILCKAEGGGAKVVEYSEMDQAAAREIDPASGELRLNAGNICNHFYTTDFLARAAAIPTPYHLAKKKIPAVNAQGETETPGANNGVKLEQFIFDTFPHSRLFACAEVLREDEFGPVKNAPGAATDSPDTARRLLLDLGRRYIEAAGGTVVPAGGTAGAAGVEVSPLVSYRGEGLEPVVAAAAGRSFQHLAHVAAEGEPPAPAA